MKNNLIAIAILFVLSYAAPVLAQSNVIKVDVPFDFSVRNKHYSAGEYRIQQASDNGGQRMVWILSDSKKQALLLAKTKGGASTAESMTFNRHGESYFLTSFVVGNIRIELPTTRAEKDARNGNKNLAQKVVVKAKDKSA
ncbi:MAG: hypothetical protein HKN33_10755 [Pyrinomonadaceae bacterium]|nr:hypothetical protein [Pyrinomonadaceae bacterium]